jgi:hypothetical protein
MKVIEAKEKIISGVQLDVEVMRNPAELSEWVLWIREQSGKSFLLSDDHGAVIESSDLTQLCHFLKNIGFRQATVVF